MRGLCFRPWVDREGCVSGKTVQALAFFVLLALIFFTAVSGMQ